MTPAPDPSLPDLEKELESALVEYEILAQAESRTLRPVSRADIIPRTEAALDRIRDLYDAIAQAPARR